MVMSSNVVKTFAVIFAVAFILSCGVPESTDQVVEIYQPDASFIQRTMMLAGEGAVHCDSEVERQYECIANNFKNNHPLYAYGSFIGMDSLITLSVAYNGKNVYFLEQDDVFGPQSRYKGYLCGNPTLSEKNAILWRGSRPFKCASYRNRLF